MELDDLKKVWTKVNSDAKHPLYSVKDISDFRKARSKDFSTWIQNGILIDLILKCFFIFAFLILIWLLRDSTLYIFVASAIILLGFVLIFLEIKYLKTSRDLDKSNISVQEGIKAKLAFLKTYYYRIQFLQGLTNPMLVAAGISFYYYSTYNQIVISSTKDILVILLLLFVSFLFTLPTTLSLYGYHYRILKSSLANLEDEVSWNTAISKYNKQKKCLYWIFGSLLFIGVLALTYLVLL